MIIPIVVVTHNNLSTTKEFIKYVYKFTKTPFYFVFVDNGSSDGTLNYLRTIPNSIILPLSKNYGVAVARTLGVMLTNERFICLLDNDLFPITDRWLEKLLKEIKKSKTIGMVSGIDQTEADLSSKGDIIDVEQIPGSGLIRREMFLDLYGYDYINFPAPIAEDTDLCYRALRMGWRFKRVTFIKLLHYGKKFSNEEFGITRSTQTTFTKEVIEEQREHFWRIWESPKITMIVLGKSSFKEVNTIIGDYIPAADEVIYIAENDIYIFRDDSRQYTSNITNLDGLTYGMRTKIAIYKAVGDIVLFVHEKYLSEITISYIRHLRSNYIKDNYMGFKATVMGVDIIAVSAWKYLIDFAEKRIETLNNMQDIIELIYYDLRNLSVGKTEFDKIYVFPRDNISPQALRYLIPKLSQKSVPLGERLIEIKKAFQIEFNDWKDYIISNRRYLELSIKRFYPFLKKIDIDFCIYSKGYTNLNLILKDENSKRFLLRLYGPRYEGNKEYARSFNEVKNESEILEELYSSGFPCPAIIRPVNNKHMFKIKVYNRTFYGILMEFLPGKTLEGRKIPDDELIAIIKLIATLHCKFIDNWKKYSMKEHKANKWISRLMNWIEESLDRIRKTVGNTELPKELNNIVKTIENIKGEALKSRGAITLLHNDIAPSNFIKLKNKIYMIDFDDYTIDYNFYDLATLVCNFNLYNQEKVEFVIDYYNKEVLRKDCQELYLNDFSFIKRMAFIKKSAESLYYLANDLESGNKKALRGIKNMEGELKNV